MNGSRIIVPKSLQQEYLQCLHMGHLGISKCRARAKTTVFWPLVNLLCNVILVVNTNMTLQVVTNTMLKLIFQVIFMELISVTLMVKYMLCVDYFSFFIWERPLPDMQSDTGLKNTL